MIIVVEGPNNVGKTTFINTLLKHLPNYTIEHTSNICPNNFNYYSKCLKKDNIIYDRLHIGEMVYPKIYKRKAKINQDEFDELLKIENVIYVFVSADLEFIINAYERKGEEFDFDYCNIELEEFDKLYGKLKSSNCNVIRFKNHIISEYSDMTISKAIDYIISEV